MTKFNISSDSPVCSGDFDQGRLCMFTTALTPFGPFPQPQWAAFIPKEHFLSVANWAMQYRGPFDIFIHPNTGFERQDHRDWGLWGGNPHRLDLSADEFDHVLAPADPVFNCRSDPVVYPIPTKVRHAEPKSGFAHIRYFRAFDFNSDAAFTVEPLLNDNLNGVPATLLPMDHNWYDDLLQLSGDGTYEISISSENDVVARAKIPSEIVKADAFITAVLFPTSINKPVVFFADDNHVADGYGKVRFINLRPQVVYLFRTLYGNEKSRTFLQSLNLLDSLYDTQLQAQYVYEVYSDHAGAHLLLTLPTYLSDGEVSTAYLRDEVVLVQDFPQDSPRDPK
jgi:aromatic ring-cleaving dioxygenase